MILERGLDFGSDFDLLLRIPDQVADHPDTVAIRELDQHDQIWAGILERRMSRVPDSFPAIDSSAPGKLLPSEIE
jgi:hypothetical protein